MPHTTNIIGTGIGERHLWGYAAVLADPAIAFVGICLRRHLHFQACMDALKVGKGNICEKPLVASLSQADEPLAKVAETGGFLSPVFQYRYGIGMAILQASIKAGLAYADVATRVHQIKVENCVAPSILMESGALITFSITLGCAEDISGMCLMFESFTVESNHTSHRPAESPWIFSAREPADTGAD